MPTTYPGAIDSLSNPTAGSFTSNPSHSDQHTDINDIAEAIETELGTNPSGASATVAARFTAAETATSDHLADATGAHAATAISYAGGTGMSATNVETAIDELATEKLNAAEKAAASGVASLDGSTKIPIAQVPTGTSGTTVALGNHGHAIQAASATRTSADYTTASTTFVDVDATNLSLVITTLARRVLIGCMVTCFNSTNNSDIYFDVLLDGARLGQTKGLVGETAITASSTIHNLSFTFLTATLTAASHTFKLQWRVTAGTATARASTGQQPLHFYVIEQGV